LIQTDLQTLRRRLVEAGIPHVIADDPNRGSYLAALLGQRLAGEETSVKRAAETAGVEPNTVRVWRKRSPAFAQAEHRARHGAVDEDGELEPHAIEVDAPPEPEVIQHLRDRLRKAYDNCAQIGNGPYRGSPFQIEHQVGSYTANRQGVIDLIAELQSYGITDRLPPVPAPLNPQPRQPMRQRSPIDTSGWLWPTSINRHLPRRAR
jgi:transposase-like protein